MKNTGIFTLLILALVGAAWAGWKSETVASEGDVGAGCCLAVDRWGRPHISYADKTQEKAMYAHYNGSSWEFQTVASDVGVFGKTGQTLDPFDKPHILFLDNIEVELDYAYFSGGKWVTEKVDGGFGLGETVSILVWPSEPRAAYYKLGYRYGYRDGEGWHTELVTSGFGGFIRLFADGENTPNVVFSNAASESVERAVRKSTGWSIDNISEGVDSDAFFGPDSKIHVSFADFNNEGLTYAVSTGGGSWKFENVKAAAGAPASTQICANAAGDVFISYFNFNNHNLHVVTKRNGVWTHELVATGGYVGRTHSIAPGPDGYPLIAYYDATNGDLKLARYVTDVELTSFTAERTRGGVDIHWTVNGAEGVAGFNLYREPSAGGREKVNDALVKGQSPFTYVDGAAPETECRYWLEAVAAAGTARTFGPASVPPAAKGRAFALYQNVPNPVAGATTFSFELLEGSNVELAVYDAAGRKVTTVAEGYFAAGRHDVPFRGNLAPGIYVYRLDAGAKTAARKMVVTK
jgi:hypothetical protein